MTLASQIFLSSIPILINLYAARYRQEDELSTFVNQPKDFGLPVEDHYDFIIVGAGTAGSILARRLTDKKFSVLLLEAGGNPPPLQQVPFTSTLTKDLGDINFLYRSTPEKNAGLANGGIMYTPAGKMMGGSSSHNDQIYERGHPLDYNQWALETKDRSWRYKNLVKYFKKSENYMGKFPRKGQHGKNGPMTVTQPRYAPGRSIWLEAGKELGYDVVDSNGPQKEGFSPNEFNRRFGRRVSTYSAYIQPIETTQKFLTIRRYSIVSEILISKKVAKGVLYKQHGVQRRAKARKEVILSAGVYMSPILLIKSGIGPLDQLKNANVTPVAILPGVGEHLMDHPYLEVSPIFIEDPSKTWFIEQNLTFNDFTDFVDRGYGPLATSFRVGQAEAFIASKRALGQTQTNKKWPDLQICYSFMGSIKNSVSCFIGLNRPLSRGRLTVNPTVTEMDSNDLPILNFNHFSVDSDFNVMIEGINFCLETMKTQSFQKLGAKFSVKPIKQCKREKFRSDEYWRCYIRQLTGPSFHSAGTCKMGRKGDSMAVVDSQLRVIGIKRLRVVDASVMPVITNSNIAAGTILISEKTASDILRQYKRKNKKL